MSTRASEWVSDRLAYAELNRWSGKQVQGLATAGLLAREEDFLDPAVAARVQAAEHKADTDPPLFAYPLVFAAVAAAVGGGALLLDADAAFAMIATFGTLVTLVWIGVILARQNPLNRLSDEDYRAINDAKSTAQAFNRDHFGYVGAYSTPPAQIPTPTMALAGTALSALWSISTSPAWAATELDEHRVRLNLDEERTQILRSLVLLERGTVDEPNRADTSAAGQRLIAAWDERQVFVEQARSEVRGRIEALKDYHLGLEPIEALLENRALLSSMRRSDQDLGEYFETIAKNEAATAHIEKLGVELADIEANLAVQVGYLSDVIALPAQPLAVQ